MPTVLATYVVLYHFNTLHHYVCRSSHHNSVMHLLCIQKWEEPREMLLLRRRKDKGELQAVRTFRSREMEEPSTTAHRKREGLTSPVWKGKQRFS